MSRGDRWLLVLPLALTAVGLIMVYSSSAILGLTRYHDPNHFLTKQLFRVALGLLVFAVASLRADLRLIEKHAPRILAVAVVLLMVVVVAGHVAGGAMRWIRLGTVTLQPTDVARLAAVVFLARYHGRTLEAYRQDLRCFGLGKFAFCLPRECPGEIAPIAGSASASPIHRRMFCA